MNLGVVTYFRILQVVYLGYPHNMASHFFSVSGRKMPICWPGLYRSKSIVSRWCLRSPSQEFDEVAAMATKLANEEHLVENT